MTQMIMINYDLICDNQLFQCHLRSFENNLFLYFRQI
jgi:hypothetical protein